MRASQQPLCALLAALQVLPGAGGSGGITGNRLVHSFTRLANTRLTRLAKIPVLLCTTIRPPTIQYIGLDLGSGAGILLVHAAPPPLSFVHSALATPIDPAPLKWGLLILFRLKECVWPISHKPSRSSLVGFHCKKIPSWDAA